ncbi:MAG TPA: AMP-binding protein [Acidimicrobiia bacterium]|nr:AMP-binding protein [Acidimicrobiia bacterium]
MDWLARWARDRPSHPFLIRGPESIDFATADRRVGRLVGGLRHRFEVGSRLGVAMRPTIEDLLVALAVQASGMVLVPLPAAATDEERTALGLRAGVTQIVAPEDALDGSPTPVENSPDDTSVAIFTSGTSGVPRAVRLTWANIEASAAASALHLGQGVDDRWLAVLPLHHVGGLSILWRSARQGSTVVLAPGFEAHHVARLLTGGQVSLGSFVSAMLERLVDVGMGRARGFRYGLVGGGPVTERALTVGGMRLLATYGMTETASQVATADPADPLPDRLVVLEGVDIRLDESDRIVVDGAMVSPGDLDGPDRTGPLVTSDLGRMHDGRLEVTGRADTVIVTGGENVMPERVERIAAGLPGAGEVAVVGLDDERWGAVVAAAYTGTAEPAELDAAMRVRVAGHEVPRRWLRVASIPMAGIGKVDRRAVASLFD